MKVAGIDVHKKVLMAVVVDGSLPEEKPARRRFVTMPSELHRLLTWLREQGVEEAVMESTAQYWRSVWLELEPHMRLHLAQAFSNRAPRGRKHDFKDAERLVRRLIADELILSFVPSGEQRNWRGLTRMKLQLTRDRVRLQNQIECLLEEMRIKLDCGQQSIGCQRIAHSACFGQRRDRPPEVSATGWGAVAVHRRATGGCFDGKSTARAWADVGPAARAAAINRSANGTTQ